MRVILGLLFSVALIVLGRPVGFAASGGPSGRNAPELSIALAAVPTEPELRAATLALDDLPAGYRIDREDPNLINTPSFRRTFLRTEPNGSVSATLLGSRTITPRVTAEAVLTSITREFNIGGVPPTGAPANIGEDGWRIRTRVGNTNRSLAMEVIAWAQGEITVVMTHLLDADDVTAARASATYAAIQQAKIARLVPPPIAPSAQLAPPAAPRGLRIVSTSATTISVQWDAVDGAASYAVFAATAATATVVDAPATGATIGGLIPNAYHCLIVIARNTAGYSPWSEWLCADTAP